MSPKKILALGLVLLFSFLVLTPSFNVKASEGKSAAGGGETKTNDPPACALSADKFDELKTTEENVWLDPNDKIRAELGVRKALLSETVDCAVKEATDLRLSLNSTEIKDADLKNFKGKLLSQIESDINYYEVQKSKIADLGLRGSKDFAKSLISWREGNYETFAKLASNLIIWAGNQNLIEAAKNRIDQIGRAMSLLKITDNEEIQGLWENAQANFKSANDYNKLAADNLKNFAPPEESLANIKSSLEALSNTYKNFFDLVSAIKAALSPS